MNNELTTILSRWGFQRISSEADVGPLTPQGPGVVMVCREVNAGDTRELEVLSGPHPTHGNVAFLGVKLLKQASDVGAKCALLAAIPDVFDRHLASIELSFAGRRPRI